MEVSQGALFRMMLSGLLLGAFLGLFYEVLRLVRRAFSTAGGDVPEYALQWKLLLLGRPITWRRHGKLADRVVTGITFFCDVLFGLTAGLAVLLLIYDKNDGVFRLSAPLSVSGGFFLFHISVGRLTSMLMDGILFFTGIFFRYLFLILSFPFRRFVTGLACLYRQIILPVLERQKRRRREARSVRLTAMILRSAETAFFMRSEDKEGK